MLVAALRSPPTVSISSAMSRAERRRVPLNAICSRRCDKPCSLVRSWRDPAPTKTPSEAVSRCAMRSVAILRPDGKVGDLNAHGAARFDAHAARAWTRKCSISLWSLGRESKTSLFVRKDRRGELGKSGRHPGRVRDRGGKFGGMLGGAQNNERALGRRCLTRGADCRPRCAGRRGTPFLASFGRSPPWFRPR